MSDRSPPPRPSSPSRARLTAVAIWNKTIELLVLAKIAALQNGVPRPIDRRALAQVHRLMLAQVERMRASTPAAPEAGTSSTGVHNRAVALSAADPAWRAAADTEVAAIGRALGEHGAGVHHIGSTAIDGFVAKPILDFAAELPADDFPSRLGAARERLGALGYRYVGVRGGYFFEKGPAPVRTHALQVHAAGSPMLAELLRFRDALRSDAELRRDYAAVKAALAYHCPRARLLYASYKFHWIAELQWRQTEASDWAEWFVAHKRAQAQLARIGFE